MTIGVSVSKIEFYIYDVESGDEITNEDGSARTFILKDGEANKVQALEHLCDDIDTDMLEEITQ
jgi:hypothetical protein